MIRVQRWSRCFHGTGYQMRVPLPVRIASSALDVETFRRLAFQPQEPIYLESRDALAESGLPAFTKWFTATENPKFEGQAIANGFSTYMNKFQDWLFPYELIISSQENLQVHRRFQAWLLESQHAQDELLARMIAPSIQGTGPQRFFQFNAPLSLLFKALHFNRSQSDAAHNPIQLYIAQSALSELPTELQNDLPIPELVQTAGKGDVYASSVWLGAEPTYTPLHRDPNPNLFYQLYNYKSVRLLPPPLGERLFLDVQVRLKRQASSRLRQVDMMESEEREALHDAVWESDSLPEEARQVEVRPGDGLFVPLGWWHSIKSKGLRGGLNASVNWWFR